MPKLPIPPNSTAYNPPLDHVRHLRYKLDRMAKILDDIESVQVRTFHGLCLKLAEKADTEQVDRDGNTPLMVAVKTNLSSIAELLVKYDADIETVDRNEKTTLVVAVERKFLPITELLVNSLQPSTFQNGFQGAHQNQFIRNHLDNEFNHPQRFKSLEQLKGFKLLRQRVDRRH